MTTHIATWLDAFQLQGVLHAHAVAVVAALPDDVRQDLMSDPAFRIAVCEPTGHVVTLSSPAAGRASRSVLLKRTLLQRDPAFIRYIIAHELAHAFLRNAGRTPGEDPEHAADSLAAAWGFPRP